METVISTVIMIALLLMLILGLSQNIFSSQALLSESSQQLQVRLQDQSRTVLAPAGATTSPTGNSVTLIFQNTGTTKLTDFQNWDVLLQYTDGVGSAHVQWYPYPSQWVAQIYQTVSPPVLEVVEPGILDPGEYLAVAVSVSPTVGTGTTNLATIAAPNGVTATTVFTH